jgi:hypothetical protein
VNSGTFATFWVDGSDTVYGRCPERPITAYTRCAHRALHALYAACAAWWPAVFTAMEAIFILAPVDALNRSASSSSRKE